MAELDDFMKSDADPAKKEAVKAKIVALVRAMDVLPNDKLYPIKEMLQTKLLEWEMDEDKKQFLMRKQIERRLFALYDWVQTNDPSPEQIRAYLAQFRDLIGSENEFFHQNPELIGLVEKIIRILQAKMPGLMKEVEFLRIIDMINDSEQGAGLLDRTAPIKRLDPDGIELLDVKLLDRDLIEKEAPFYQGESNV
jgi:hypothetical protein